MPRKPLSNEEIEARLDDDNSKMPTSTRFYYLRILEGGCVECKASAEINSRRCAEHNKRNNERVKKCNGSGIRNSRKPETNQ